MLRCLLIHRFTFFSFLLRFWDGTFWSNIILELVGISCLFSFYLGSLQIFSVVLRNNDIFMVLQNLIVVIISSLLDNLFSCLDLGFRFIILRLCRSFLLFYFRFTFLFIFIRDFINFLSSFFSYISLSFFSFTIG